MDREPIVKEIEYYQYYLGTAISQIYINEKLCDFHDDNKAKFNFFANSLSRISSALLLSQRMIFSCIFIEDRDSKNIHKLLNKLKSNEIVPQKEIDLKIKTIADDLIAEIASQSENIDMLKKYRNNVFAHFNTKFFDDDWRENFPIQNPCDFIAIRDLAIKIFDGCSLILMLLKSVPFADSMLTPLDINELIKRLSQ